MMGTKGERTMTDLEEFIYLLHKHPEAIPFLREIAEDQALPSDGEDRSSDKSE
jgi:hypothetical protein